MPFPFAAFLICEKNYVFFLFLLKFYACLVENKVSKSGEGEEKKQKHKLAKKAIREDKGNRGRNAEGRERKQLE